ncbi:MAG: hypothetical protein H0V39_05795, partial [Nitrosomonas sp.]|nr:hypothetical protein [Nitrosomonas sp.]
MKKTSMLAFSFISFCFLANVSIAGDGYDHKHHNKDYKDDTTGGAAGGMETDSQLLIVKLIGDTVAYIP